MKKAYTAKDIGNKAYNLYDMMVNQIQIPKSYFLSCTECNEILNEYDYIKDIDILANKLAEKNFFNYEKCIDYPVIIRSSSVNEDAEDYSNAGKYLSIYNSYTRRQVVNSIVKCLTHRSDRGEMGLIIQEQLFPIYSGVAFAYFQDNTIKIRIEVAKGLGELLVSGKISPAVYKYTAANDNKICIQKSRQRIAEFPIYKNQKFIPTDDISINGERFRIMNIGRNVVYAYFAYDIEYWREVDYVTDLIIEKCKEIYQKFGNSDIEWVYTQNKELIIVQRRPIVAIPLEENSHSSNSSGMTIVPGHTSGRLVSLKEYQGENDCIVYSPLFLPKDIDKVINSRGIMSVESSMLSHSSVLAREYQIPYLAGISEDIFEQYKNRIVDVDFTNRTIELLSGDMIFRKEEFLDEFIDPAIECAHDILTNKLLKDTKQKDIKISSQGMYALKLLYDDNMLDRILHLS